MSIKSTMMKLGMFFAGLAKMGTASTPIGQHQVRGYRTSGREGFAGIAGMSKMARRKLSTGR